MPRPRFKTPLTARQGNQFHYRRNRTTPNPQQPAFSPHQCAISGGDPNAGDTASDTIGNQMLSSTSQPLAATTFSQEPFYTFSRPGKRKRSLSLTPLVPSNLSDKKESSRTSPIERRGNRRRSRVTEASQRAEPAEDRESNRSSSSDSRNENPYDSPSSSSNSSLHQPHENSGLSIAGSMPCELLRQEFCSAGNSAAKVIQAMQGEMTEYIIVEKQLSDLIDEMSASEEKASALLEEVDHNGRRKLPVVRLNVGGELFTVPVQTLLGACGTSPGRCGARGLADEADARAASSPETPCSFFQALFRAHAGEAKGDAAVGVFTDPSGAIFLDRDPETFRQVLNYLRGYRHFQTLDEDALRRLRTDARYYGLPGLRRLLEPAPPPGTAQFRPGPGVSPEQTRLRVMYGVAVVGDVVLVTGRHRITYEVLTADYVGVGLISDACVSKDQEFHKTANSCVYYMSGVFYSNFPYHRKEENLEKIDNGDYISILVDMDKGFVEYALKNFTKMISIGRAQRLRFAVTMKVSSRIRIVQEDEAKGLLMHRNRQ